ncbi:MAG TPA: ABC transporter permease [Thermoplasmata archaeon]|nr:ABC transporter permease [Thermoplasmata archaeon]
MRKAIFVVLTVFLITTFNFFIFQVLPGDPTYVVTPKGCGGSNVSQVLGSCAIRTQLIKQWGLDKPVVQRFVIYMGNLLQGNLGTSITQPYRGTPVAQVIAGPLVTTLTLIGLATVVTMWLGLVLGRISGWRRGSKSDVVITLTTLTGYSMPSFWVSLIIVWGLAYQVRVFDLPGQLTLVGDPVQDSLATLYYYVPAILVFVITNVAWFSLTLRNSLTDVLPEDYMVTAAAKGLTQEQQLRWHALPNARLPVVTASALYFGWVVSGVIVIETVFNINGLGYLTWFATINNNYPVLSGVFLIATIGVVLANAVADVLYMFLDPRVREA